MPASSQTFIGDDAGTACAPPSPALRADKIFLPASNCSGVMEDCGWIGRVEDVSDGLESACGVSAGGFDDGPDVGVLDCAPL